jgi:hypothetical protein
VAQHDKELAAPLHQAKVSASVVKSAPARSDNASPGQLPTHGKQRQQQHELHARPCAAKPRRLPVGQLAQLIRNGSRGAAQASITAQVQLCGSWQEVGELFVEFAPVLNHINVTAMVCRLSKVRH